MHTLVENYTFSVANFSNSQFNNKLNGIDHAWKSYYSVEIDAANSLRKWILGDVSKDTDEISLSRTSGAGVSCSYTSYNTTDSKSTIPKTDLSMCGFNTGTQGYCRKRKGDKWFVSDYQIYGSNNITNAKWHILSTGENWVDLQRLFKDNKYDINNWYKALKDIDPDYGWPLYADNDIWVQKTITNSYWKIDPSDSAISISYSISLALFILFAVIVY